MQGRAIYPMFDLFSFPDLVGLAGDSKAIARFNANGENKQEDHDECQAHLGKALGLLPPFVHRSVDLLATALALGLTVFDGNMIMRCLNVKQSLVNGPLINC